MSNDTERATVEEIETCGLAICPNAPEGDAPLPAARNPRLAADGAANCAVPTEGDRVDGRALALLDAHPDFNRDAFAWVGSEHLGGGIFCASVYSDTAADSPYLWVTIGEESEDGFLACVWVGDPAGDDEPDDPFLVAECSADDLAAESLRMLASAKG